MGKQRVAFLDFMKGVAAMMVVLSHLPDTPSIYNMVISFVMLPSFFFASGYLTKFPENHIIRDFLYKRVGKLFVLYSVYMFLLPFTSISEIKQIIGNPVLIIDKIKNAFLDILMGKAFWFVSCLIIINIIFLIIVLISKQNNILILVYSIALCALGVIISEKSIMLWNFDTALVCQLIFVLGYMAKEYSIIDKVKKKGLLCVITLCLYLIVVFIGGYFFGIETIAMNFALNDWGIWFISIPLMFFGVTAIALVGQLLNGVKVIDYIGAHSLIYFAFASHGGSIFNKLFVKIYEITNLAVFSNRYIINPISCMLGCLIMVIPCLLIDRFVPFLNGKFKMPIPEKYNQ